MIDSILFCKDNKSCLIFDASYDHPLFRQRICNGGNGFFMDDISFQVSMNPFLYLCSFKFRGKENYLKSNCEILKNELGFNLKIESGRVFVRKCWLERFGSNTMLGKFNIKNNYIFKFDLIRLSNNIKIREIRGQDSDSLINGLLELLGEKYKIRQLRDLTKRHPLILRINDNDILDPSLVKIEKK